MSPGTDRCGFLGWVSAVAPLLAVAAVAAQVSGAVPSAPALTCAHLPAHLSVLPAVAAAGSCFCPSGALGKAGVGRAVASTEKGRDDAGFPLPEGPLRCLQHWFVALQKGLKFTGCPQSSGELGGGCFK